MLNVREIPPNIGHYLAGFTDGEGSFNVSFRPRDDYKSPWKISREMNDGGKCRYSDEEILGRLNNPQRPYAGPVEESHGMIWSDLHGDMQSATEMSAPPPTGGQ